MWEMPEVRNNMIEDMAEGIEIDYNFKCINASTNDSEKDNLFMEYIAVSLYFRPFDINSNGY